MALAFQRWDVDAFLDELPGDVYQEWKAFDYLESLNPAGVIMKGLAGGGKKKETSWQVQKQKFLNHIAIMGGR